MNSEFFAVLNISREMLDLFLLFLNGFLLCFAVHSVPNL